MIYPYFEIEFHHPPALFTPRKCNELLLKLHQKTSFLLISFRQCFVTDSFFLAKTKLEIVKVNYRGTQLFNQIQIWLVYHIFSDVWVIKVTTTSKKLECLAIGTIFDITVRYAIIGLSFRSLVCISISFVCLLFKRIFGNTMLLIIHCYSFLFILHHNRGVAKTFTPNLLQHNIHSYIHSNMRRFPSIINLFEVYMYVQLQTETAIQQSCHRSY